MASNNLQPNNNDESDPYVIRRTWSSDGDDTTMAGSNRDSNEQELKEILNKWQVPGNLVLVDAKKTICTLLAELLMCYPKEIQLIDSKEREWDYDPRIQENSFTHEFEEVAIQVQPVRNKQQKVIKWVSITRFLTTTDIQAWKDNDYFYSHVLEAKVYMFPHPFKAEEWDISTIGCIRDIHVAHITTDYLHTTLNEIIKKQEKLPPTFQLIPQHITNQDKTATTRAYSVQCAKKGAKQMIHLLTHGDFRSNPMFIPFRYKSTNSKVFTKCIRQQNELYHRTWVIKLEGISEIAMEYIQSDILQLNGVSQIVPTKRIQSKGEWKILVDQMKCAFIHKQLTTMWNTLVANIPAGILENMPVDFSSPRISSQKVRDYQDDASDNDSYRSILTAGTETSTRHKDEDQYNELPQQYNYPSYASATAASTVSQGSTSMSSPEVSAASEWQNEQKELQEQIRQQAEELKQLQVDLQEKVIRSRDLEENLAQAIEMAHSGNATCQELLQKFEILLSKFSETPAGPSPLPPPPSPYQKNDAGTTSLKPPPTLRPMTTQPPPSKKSNQNSTPTKPFYPVFRQTEHSGIPATSPA